MTTAGRNIGPRWTRWRRTVQIAVVVLFVALPFLVVAEHTWATGTLAALRLGSVDVVEPAGATSAILAGATVTGTLLLGMVPLIGGALLLGPVFCSWICPFGLVSELVDRLRHRGRRRVWNRDGWRGLRWPRLAILATFLVAGMAVGTPLVALVSPPRLLTTLPIEAVVLGGVSAASLTFLGLLVVVDLVAPRRLWCRTLCPVGSFAKVLRTPRTLTVRWTEASCTCPGVPVCQTRCPWGIDPRWMEAADGCTTCLACIEGCPSASLHLGFGREREWATVSEARPAADEPTVEREDAA